MLIDGMRRRDHLVPLLIWAFALWPFAYVLTAMAGVRPGIRAFASLATALMLPVVAGLFIRKIGGAGAAGVLAFLEPRGRDPRPSLDAGFSAVEALVARGDREGAARWFRDELHRRPRDWALRLHAADFFAADERWRPRAARLYRQVAVDETAPAATRARAARRAEDLSFQGSDDLSRANAQDDRTERS